MKKKRIIIGLLLGITITSLLLFFLTVKEKEKSGVLKIVADKADLYVRDFNFTEVGDPDSTWNIKADSARYMRNENVAVLEHVTVTMTASDGEVYYLKGDEGRFHTESKNMTISGNVEIYSEHGDHVSTDSITYSDAEKEVTTGNIVTMRNNYVTLQGVGLSLLLKQRHLALLSKVDAVIDSRILQ